MSAKAMKVSRRYGGMKSNSSDNFQTRPFALDCLLPYIPKHWRIWEPAAGKGNLVREMKARGYEVTATDILTKFDFLTTALKENEYEVSITNPPYSIKDEWLARCYALGNPFALLLPITVFDSNERRRLMDIHGVQFVFPPRRCEFTTPNGKEGGAWFYCAWLTHGLNLPETLNFPQSVQGDLVDFVTKQKKPPERIRKQPPEGRFNGKHYKHEFDYKRLRGQMLRVYDCMKAGKWRTLGEIETLTGDPQSSISAQLRHFRKSRFGAHTIEVRSRGERSTGLFEYRLVVRE